MSHFDPLPPPLGPSVSRQACRVSGLRRCSRVAPAAREVLVFDLPGISVTSAPSRPRLITEAPQILTFPKMNGRRQMSATTPGSVANFYEKRAKVTHGHLNKARADWLLYSTFRESNRSRFSLPDVARTDSEIGSS